MSRFPTWLIVALSGSLGILFLLVVIGIITSFTEDATAPDKIEPNATAKAEASPMPTEVVEQPMTENDILCDNHRDLLFWGLVSEGHDPYVEIASIQVPLPSSERYNADYYRDIRALVPCNDHTLAVSFVPGDTFEMLLAIRKSHFPDIGDFSPYLYCERAKKITDTIATALERAEPTAPKVIEEQIAVIRELDVGGRLSDEHAYLLAFADALEAALSDIEATSKGAAPADKSRMNAVTNSANALTPVMRDVCDPSIIN